MDAGKLDQRVLIQVQSSGTDELNTPTGDWLPLATVAAMVRQSLGREFLKGDYHGEDRAVFTIRYRADVDSKARIVWAGKSWDITSVNGTRRTRYLDLMANSVDGAS